MALSRARIVCGTPSLTTDIKAVISETLTQERKPASLLTDVAEMRERIDKEHHSDFIWEVKYIRGGLVDIEFSVQYLQLKHAHQHPDILSANTNLAIQNLRAKELLDGHQADTLADALNLWQTVQGMLRLTIEGYFQPGREHEVPRALAQALAEAGGDSDIDALKNHMKQTANAVYQVYHDLIGEP